MVVRTEEGGVGTGVLVGKIDPVAITDTGWPEDPWSKEPSRIFLVTARHVLGDNASVIESTLRYYIDFNAISGAGLVRASAEFTIENEPRNWRVHPDADVDIAALDVTGFIAAQPAIRFSACPLTEIANPISILKKDIAVADEIFALGYPTGLSQGDTALPIARKGILATSPRIPLLEHGIKKSAFLIDGAIIPGSSGSPLICASEFFLAADLEMTPNRPILLGIVTDQMQGIDAGEYIHLGRVHHAVTIIETLLEFDSLKPEDFLSLDRDAYWTPALQMPEWSIDPFSPTLDAASARNIMHEVRVSYMIRKAPKLALGQFIADQEFGIHRDRA